MSSKREVEIADTLPPEEDETTDSDDPGASAKQDEAAKQNETKKQDETAKQAVDDPPARPADRPPVTGWDRYELQELLGKGGMGTVYKARDRRLGRTVAIKFIQGANPNLTMRFLQEARAQARIDHPNVCRVYEADEVDGRAYIALQYIDGEPLHRAAGRMSLDEKIAAMRDIAVAVHEAHRLGIVHRDLKPANVLVERRDDARWVPIVMDFGLAREATVEVGLTESGVPLGTPAYMSPEQARGDIHAIDRRSDVYGLGATLYELLTGQIPFPTSSYLEAFQRAIHDDPPPPRSHVPSLPVDLETITLKCLAKDPVQRYPSTRALADDLARYLDGEPILGRREAWWQRMRRRARRHRALVTLGAASLVAIVAIATLGIRERVLAGDRARLAERLGREASGIESALHEAYLLPLQDIRSKRAGVRERMHAIATMQHGLGGFGDALVHEALGRGHLALHEWRDAADELTRAAEGGVQTPELHAARGRALGELYHRALEDVRRRTEDSAWLAERQQQLERQYLAPALAEIKSSRALSDEAALLEARLALYRRDFATAERDARAVAERSPGSSEALKLAADAAYGASIDAFDRGDYDAAREAVERTKVLYKDAIDIARSDGSLYQAAAEAWLQLAEIDFRQQRSSAESAESLDRALDVLDHGALRADPDDATSYITKSYVFLRRYLTSSFTGQDDLQSLSDRMAQAAARAVEIDPWDTQGWLSLGNAYLYRGRYEFINGGQSALWWNAAVEAFGNALMIEPDDARANNELGTAHLLLGARLHKTGSDPRTEYEAARRSYERAREIDPQYLPACTSEVDLHASLAEDEDMIGDDPRSAVEDATRIGKRCLDINPRYYVLLDNLAQAQLALAHYLIEKGDPMPALTAARGYLDRAEDVERLPAQVWYHRLVAAGIEAAFRLHRPEGPTSSIATGRRAFDQAVLLMPGSAEAYIEAARLDLVEAAWEKRAGHAFAAALAQACADAEHAVALDKNSAAAQQVAAEVYLQVAKTEPSRAAIEQGQRYARDALRLNPRLARAKTTADELEQLRAP